MTAFDIQRFVDGRRISRLHIVVLLICSLVMFIDGLDVFMVGKIAPAIARGFGEKPAAMTQVFLFQQIGLAFGAFIASPLADRFGRRRMLIIAATAFGVLTVASVFSQSLLQLAVLRAIAGLFLSGGLPMATALIAEFTPLRRRSAFLAIALSVYTAGGAAGGAIAAWLLDDYGWQSAFWIGGLVPLALVPLILLLLPESMQILAGRSGRDREIIRTLRRLDRGVELKGDEDFVAGDGSRRAESSSLFEIFKDGRARSTVVLWLCCVFSMGNIALLAAWMATFFQEMAGVPIQKFGVLSLQAFVGSVAGVLTMGWLMDRISPVKLIPIYYVGLAASLVSLALAPFGTPGFLAALIAWNFCQSGGQAGLNNLAALIYPASMRSTGLGWAGGAGRVGGVIAPLFGGVALASGMPLLQTLLIIAVPSLIVAMTLPLIGARARPLAPVAV